MEIMRKMLLCITISAGLSACGGGGGGDSGTSSNSSPTNVILEQVQAINSNSLNVSWATATDDTTPANQLTYEIHVSETENFTPSAATLKFSGKNVTTAQLTSLKAEITYTVKLVVTDAQGVRTVSNAVQVTTPNIQEANKSPTNVVLNQVQAINQSSLNVNWAIATDDTTPANQLTYEVHISESANFIPSSSTLGFMGKGVTSASVQGLKAATSYNVLLVVVDAQGFRTSSNAIQITTPNVQVVNQAPTNVVLSHVKAVSPFSVTATWLSASDDSTAIDKLTYEVHVSETANFIPNNSTLVFSGKNVNTTTIQGLKAATNYTVKLIAVDSQGFRTESSGILVTTLNSAPSNVALSEVKALNPTVIAVNWLNASDDTTSANELLYEVHISENDSFTPNSATLKFTGKGVTSAKIVGLKAVTDYKVILVAVDAQGLRTVSNSMSVKTMAFIPSPSRLNDTGITWCANANSLVACTEVALGSFFEFSQDAKVGRDVLAAQGLLEKVGAGTGSFDFTKIGENGEKLSADATTWSCVLDNHTGMMWEVKTKDGGLHDGQKTYTWYNPDGSTNGGKAGLINSGNNTDTFTKTVNQNGLCGYKNWRLPTRQELVSIMDYSKKPLIDNTYFPNIQKHWYWTITPDARSFNDAWLVLFADGYVGFRGTGSLSYAMLVNVLN